MKITLAYPPCPPSLSKETRFLLFVGWLTRNLRRNWVSDHRTGKETRFLLFVGWLTRNLRRNRVFDQVALVLNTLNWLQRST